MSKVAADSSLSKGEGYEGPRSALCDFPKALIRPIVSRRVGPISTLGSATFGPPACSGFVRLPQVMFECRSGSPQISQIR
jgi:hypothetical protein